MSHCQSSVVRACARHAEASGIDVKTLLSEHAIEPSTLDDRDQRLPWSLFVALLERLQSKLGGPLGLEQFGADLAQAHPLFAVLKALHFGLFEIQQIAAERWVTHAFDGVVQPLVSRQADGAMRVTLSIGRDTLPSYAFWTWMLGAFRPLPRLFGLSDAHVEVEMAERFAEFLVILPVDAPTESSRGSEIRSRVRESLLKDLVRYEELRELTPTYDPRGRPMPASVAPALPGIGELEQDIRAKLMVEGVQLYVQTTTGLRRVGRSIGPERARIRRVFWLGGAAVGAVEIERPSDTGHAREASLLDEYIDGFAYRFAEIQNRLPYAGFSQAEPEIREPSVGEPPPSSRGRLARAARDGRLRELAELWQLSDRQRAVLALLVDGLGNREIAARLGCSIGTIENHVTKLLKRAAVDNRAALTATFWKTQRR